MTTKTFDQDSFKTLFEEHYDLLCNYLNSYSRDWPLSQEIAQKAFVRIWEKREEISINASSKSYLFQVGRNLLVDHYRSQKIADHHKEQFLSRIGETEEIAFQDGHTLLIAQKINWAVNQLKPKPREIFNLNKREGLTYDEIAEYLKISKRTVEYNMKIALLELKELLKDKL